MPSFCEARASSGRTLSATFRSRRGLVELDRAVVVAAGRRLEQDRALAVDAQDRGREAAGVAVVQAEAAAVGVDVAERIGQQVDVALLEDLDRPEVRGLDDRAHDGRR